jgi:hypothetical protein
MERRQGDGEMSNQPIPTVPLSDPDKSLRDKFYESIAAQSDLMDKLCEHLLTLELAIPGLYATVLKLVSGDKATVIVNPSFCITFVLWLAALGLTLFAFIPRKWTVDPTILKQDPNKLSEGLGIEDFFEQSAAHKRRLIVFSSVLFFAGIVSAAFTISP